MKTTIDIFLSMAVYNFEKWRKQFNVIHLFCKLNTWSQNNRECFAAAVQHKCTLHDIAKIIFCMF